MMKRAWVVLALGLALGCGGSNNSSGGGGGNKNLANFQGATWSGTINTSVNCSGTTTPGSGSFSVAFSAGSGADLQYTSGAGCLFKFNVSGNTASLSNGPVSCSVTTANGTVTTTVTSYTVTTSDGRNLSFTFSGTASSGTTMCSVTASGTATR